MKLPIFLTNKLINSLYNYHNMHSKLLHNIINRYLLAVWLYNKKSINKNKTFMNIIYKSCKEIELKVNRKYTYIILHSIDTV